MTSHNYSSREMMTIMAAREIKNGDIVFAGTGISMLAATAAKTQCHVQEQQKMLDEEGPIVRNDRGTQIANPRHSVLMQSMNIMQTVWRTLGLSASQRGLTDKKNIGPLQDAEREAKKAVNKAKANSLIA